LGIFVNSSQIPWYSCSYQKCQVLWDGGSIKSLT
jgi:hypothetical protein